MNIITYNPALTTFLSLKGYNFDRTKYVLLSSNAINNTYNLTAVNFFSNLSTFYPPLTGTVYYNYNVRNKNELEVMLYDLKDPGNYDVILLNQLGYFKLTNNDYIIDALSIVVTPSVTPTLTPTPSITPTVTPTITLSLSL